MNRPSSDKTLRSMQSGDPAPVDRFSGGNKSPAYCSDTVKHAVGSQLASLRHTDRKPVSSYDVSEIINSTRTVDIRSDEVTIQEWTRVKREIKARRER